MFIGEFMCGILFLWVYYKNCNVMKIRLEEYLFVVIDEMEIEEEEYLLGYYYD